jgi:hypothetical protein
MANLPNADLILMLGEVLFQARRMLEIATLRFLQTAKREKLYPGQRLIEELFSPHSSLIADKIVHPDVSRGIIKRLIAASLGVTRVAEPDIGASFPGLLGRIFKAVAVITYIRPQRLHRRRGCFFPERCDASREVQMQASIILESARLTGVSNSIRL